MVRKCALERAIDFNGTKPTMNLKCTWMRSMDVIVYFLMSYEIAFSFCSCCFYAGEINRTVSGTWWATKISVQLGETAFVLISFFYTYCVEFRMGWFNDSGVWTLRSTCYLFFHFSFSLSKSYEKVSHKLYKCDFYFLLSDFSLNNECVCVRWWYEIEFFIWYECKWFYLINDFVFAFDLFIIGHSKSLKSLCNK